MAAEVGLATENHAGAGDSKQQAQTGSTREIVQPVALSGQVVDEQGKSVTGAVLSWVALTESDLEWEPAWRRDDWGRLGRSERWTRSDQSGFFAFQEALEVEALRGSVLWASSPGYLAACRELTHEDRDAGRIVLSKAELIQVRVLDSSSRPVAGALVEQFGMARVGIPRESKGNFDENGARRQLRRESRTDASGMVRLPGFPGEQVIQASTDVLRSAPWKGIARGRIDLRLLETFSVGGRVSLPDWSHLNYEGERRITIGTRLGNTRKSLKTIRHVVDGAWGPVQLPLIQGVEYAIRLEGSPIIPVLETFESPGSDAHLVMDLVAKLGHDIWIAGVDESGEIVPNSEGSVWWEVDGVRHEIHRRCYEDSSYINLWSLPSGSVNCSIRAPGYVPVFGGPIAIPQVYAGVLSFVLKKAGSIEGQCLYEGEPVEDFEIYIWGRDLGSKSQTIAFSGRKDGRFLIETAPIGVSFISASSGSIPACEAQQVRVSSGSIPSVTLHLVDGSEGVGSVVDLQSGRPIAEAEVQRFVMADGVSHGQWGRPLPVREDGTYRISGLSIGENRLRLRAPGYGQSYASAVVRGGEVADFGVLPLSRSQTLEIRLVSTDRNEDLSEFVAYAEGAGGFPATRFSIQGIARVEGVSPGVYLLRIRNENRGNDSSTTKLDLRPGASWVVTRRLSGGNRLTVDVIPAGGAKLSDVADITIGYARESGMIETLERGLRDDGTYFTDEIDADSVTVNVRGLDFHTIATAQGDFGDDGELFLSVILGGEPLLVYVVDSDGKPIRAVQIQVSDTEESMFRAHASTNDAGLARMIGVPDRPVLISLNHSTKGTRVISYGGGPGEEEYELRNDAGVRLLFRDGDLPLAGARAAVVDVMGNFLTNSRVSKAEGWVHWIGLTAGEYRIRAEHPQTWAVDLNVTATLAGQDVVIQMRRLGSLVIEVLTEAGLPVAGAALALESVETGTSVADWLQAGQVRSTGLVTDNQGRVRVDGLPHGAYRWSVSSSGERVGQGALTVRPTEETLETIRIVE